MSLIITLCVAVVVAYFLGFYRGRLAAFDEVLAEFDDMDHTYAEIKRLTEDKWRQA